jgi:hypothetical protein
MASRNVVVTTDKNRRGVFSGELASNKDGKIVLKNARMAVYWSSDVHGVLGLAANGPTQSCRITPKIPRIELDGVTAVMSMTDEAVEAWEKEPWG